MIKLRLLSLFSAASLTAASAAPAPARLKVSDNHRFLVTGEGQPFFYLGDTAWEIFHRLNREEAVVYLDNRAKLGFTVIQAVAIAEFDGLTKPSAYGYLPLTDNDPLKPAVKDGPQNDYWDQVDFIVDEANARGLTIGFLPTWGRFWHDKDKDRTPVFTPDNAEAYGEWLGKRYKEKALIWILGGDRPVENDTHREIMRRMALGLHKGDGGTHLTTFHPNGGQGSSQWFHDAPWLDFNMRQNGHVAEFNDRYANTRADYDRTLVKPVLDGEPIYEDHPVSFNPDKLGHSIAADVRRPLYWDLFGGACGHTYGNHCVWQMYVPGREPVNRPLMPWTEAINQPGAQQMQHGRHLMESRPFLTRVPDDSVLAETEYKSSVPGNGTRRFAATRDESGSYAMVYVPVGRKFSVRMDRITGAKVKAWWFNPRDGSAKLIGEFTNTGTKEFTPPDYGEALDWVLVLDDAAKNFPEPGARPVNP